LAKENNKKSKLWHILVSVGVIISLLLGFYQLIDRGFFDSFFVSPATFKEKIEKLEAVGNENKEALIYLQVQLESIQRSLYRVEDKLDTGRPSNGGLTKD